MKTIFIILFAFMPLMLIAQNGDIKIKVLSNKEPLGGAYIFINGKIIGYTDSLGIKSIPSKTINLGDTISASFVGHDKNEFVYNEDESAVELDLKSQFTLDEVMVYGSKFNTRRFLKRSTKDCGVNHWSTTFSFDFEVIEDKNNVQSRHVGHMNVTFSIAEYKPYIISFECPDDIQGADSYIADSFSTLLRCSRFYFNHFLDKDYVVKYMGKEGSDKVFSYTNNYMQVLIKVDDKNRLLKQMETSTLHSTDTVVIIKASYTSPNKYSYINIKDGSIYKKTPQSHVLVKVSNIKSKQYNHNTYQKYFL